MSRISSGLRSRTVAYFACFICHGLVISSLGPTLPALARHANVGLDQISLLFVVRSLGFLVGSLLGGRLYDLFPGHRILASVLVLNAVMMFFTPVAPILLLLATAMGLLGVAEGALDVGTNTLLVWLHGRKVPPFMNALHFFFGVGSFVAPLIVAHVVLATGDITLAYWALAAVLIPVAIWIFVLPSPTARHDPSGRETAHVPAFVVAVALFFFLYVGAEMSFGGWIFTYASRLGLEDPTHAAYLTSAFWGSFTLGRLLSIPLAARFKPRTILGLDLAGAFLGVAAIIALRDSRLALWAGTMLVGFSMAPIFPTMLSLAGQRTRITGTITGWFFVGGSLGAMTVPWLIGQLFEPIGPHITMFIILASLALATVVLFLLYRLSTKRGATS